MLAEADGNRTRQTELLGLVGFEDRGAHQDTYASELTSNPHRGAYQAINRRPDRISTVRRARPRSAAQDRPAERRLTARRRHG